MGESDDVELDVLKLDMLRSLATSQQAIASIMVSVADLTACSKQTAKKVAENIEVIAQYQRVLADKITSTIMHRENWEHREQARHHHNQKKQIVRAQNEGKPWLYHKIKLN